MVFRLPILILFISLSAYGHPKPQRTLKSGTLSAANGWKTLKGANYSITYPPDWTLEQFEELSEEPGLAYLKFFLYAPASPHDILRENVNMMTQDIKGIAPDFNDYIKQNEAQIKAQASTSAFIESKRIKHGTLVYHRMIYLTAGFLIPNRIEQFYFMAGTKACTFTFTSGQTEFQKTRKTVLKIVESFRHY